VWKNRKIGALSDFEREQIVIARLAGASVTKTTTLLGYRERHFVRLCRHTRIIGREHQRSRTADDNEHRQKEIVVHWGLLQKITQLLKHRWGQKWIFILKALFPQKMSDVNSTDPTSTVGLQLLSLWLLNVMFRCVNDGVTTIRLERRAWYGRWVVLYAVPYIRESLGLETTQGSL
jgi:hypothetical protein